MFTDVLYILSTSDSVSLKCFSESFSLILECPMTFSELPVCCQPLDDPGVLVGLTDKTRWQPFAAWTIRLINKCLMEGTLHVEELINVSFAYSVCSSLLCYRDATLHMACFDFARITTEVIDANIIPVENVIRSIACILCLDESKSMTFRNTIYDSCMGACLHLLHFSCSDKIIESTANEIINAFPRSICSIESRELQLAMCSAYTRIAKRCHLQIWEPRLLVRMLCSERPCLPLIQCIRAAITILTPSYVLEGEVDTSTSVANLKSSVLPQISSKRSMEINSTVECKRQKTTDFLVDIEEKKKFANELKRSICLFLESAKPASLKASTLKPETNITALSLLTLLCLSFSAHPHSSLSSTIFHKKFSWIPWICKQAKDSSLLVSALPTYLQAVHNILCLQDLESREKLFQDDEFLTDVERSSYIFPKYADFLELLKLPWTCNSIIQQACEVSKIKCLCIQIFSKIGPKLNDESDLEVLDLAIHDEDEEVCIEAVTSMPVIVLCSGQIFFEKMLRKLERLPSFQLLKWSLRAVYLILRLRLIKIHWLWLLPVRCRKFAKGNWVSLCQFNVKQLQMKMTWPSLWRASSLMRCVCQPPCRCPSLPFLVPDRTAVETEDLRGELLCSGTGCGSAAIPRCQGGDHQGDAAFHGSQPSGR
ncbi:serine/threonine-protein kinase ATR-like isoform X2 [Zingiber officinale]|uniref:serine/threonine-protein kinase ATR-like isoform X2 n=1 Tax=Zingiber officinale TaxID=94328 RepID=UPI001C4C546C|nr:serine/threonine-protein kinase ATR-like isoform X2 [Zingiber officinale]